MLFNYHSLFQLSNGGRDSDVVAEQVQSGNEVTPLNQLAQRPPAEGIFCNLKARLLGQKPQVDQDLMDKKMRRTVTKRHILKMIKSFLLQCIKCHNMRANSLAIV